MTEGNIDKKFSEFSEHWRPKIIAELNGQEMKVVKFKGEFPWHSHDTIDELFVCWKGRCFVEFRHRRVHLGPGDFIVIPQGVEHRTGAEEEAEVLIFEPKNIINTGNIDNSAYTAPNGVKI